MNTKDLLERLCALHARSGHEFYAAHEVCRLFADYCSETYVTPMGSAVGIRRAGRKNAPLVMLDGHLDQIGYTVSRIEDGFLHLAPGYDRTPLPGKEVIVLGKECLYGVVAVMPPHLQANASHVDEYEHLVIDIGYPQEHACRLVSPGDVVIFLPQLDELADGHVSSPSIDDRAALASILLALDAVHKCELAVDVAVVASSREEIGGPGAQTVAYGLRPDYAIALDVTFGVQKGLDAPDGVPENCGVTITRGPHLNRRLTETLFRLAETEKILHGIEVEPGNTGTNATHIRAAGCGVATALLGLPMRYMHSPAETIKLTNIEAAARLLTAYLLSFSGGGQYA